MNVMLPTETREVDNSKQDYLLMLNQVYHEVKRSNLYDMKLAQTRYKEYTE